MDLYSVFDPAFRAYGQVVTGLDGAVAELLHVLKDAPQGRGVDYVPEYAPLQELPAMAEISEHCYGGMPIQLGWCNGYNTKLNCLEYHRDSEVNVGARDFILLLGKQDEIENGVLDTGKVKAFRVPAGMAVEVYATTLHYAPCHTNAAEGFCTAVVLPRGTNTEKPSVVQRGGEDALLWARNKWLLAHAASDEAAQGAYVGLAGENIDISDSL